MKETKIKKKTCLKKYCKNQQKKENKELKNVIKIINDKNNLWVFLLGGCDEGLREISAAIIFSLFEGFSGIFFSRNLRTS